MTTVSNTALERCRTVVALGALGVATALIAACGGTTSTGASIPSLPGSSGGTPSGASGPTTGNVGDTLSMADAGADVAHVTILQVFDPATGTDEDPPDGTRWVGFKGTIVINGSRSGSDSTDVEAIGSDGQTYGADSAYALPAFDGCTPTSDDAAELTSGETQTFCAGVGMPPGITVAKVGYSTEGVNGSAPAKLFWTVSDSSASTPTATPGATDTPSATATPGTTPNASTTDATGHVGDTLTISGPTSDTVHITLVQVFDPATGVPAGETPPDGTHWVGFDMTIAVDDGSASDESAAVDVVGSDGKTYGLGTSYHLTAMTGCTPTTGGGSGQTTTFCAGIGMPAGVTVAQVGYSEAGVDIGSPAQVTWTVP